MIIGHNFNSNHRCKKMIITLISKVISKGYVTEKSDSYGSHDSGFSYERGKGERGMGLA
jgi:hypothetical protein